MLNISESNRNIVIGELRFVAEQMRLAQTPADKMYFFSGATGMIQRVFNIQYDAELLFAYQVLALAQNQIGSRVNQPNQPPQISTTIVSHILEQVGGHVEELADRWEKEQEITDLLQSIAITSYAASGNGHYLVIKDQLAI